LILIIEAVFGNEDPVMPQTAYRGLSIGLRIVSVLLSVGGLFMIFSGKPGILRVMMHPPEPEVSTLLLFLLKELGGVMIMLSVMLFLAARDPARNVAILDALIVGLCVLAITPLLSLKMLDIGKLYPAYFIWGRALVRLVFAMILLYLRPRENLGHG
jgi:hypothetical protein